MAEENKNSVQDAKKYAPEVERNDTEYNQKLLLQITVPNVFNTKNNPNVKMVSVVDATSQNGFRTFGVNSEDIIQQRTETGKNGKVNTLSTIQLRDDESKPYDTSILVGRDANGKPQYEHASKTGAEIKALWNLQAQANQNKQVQLEGGTPVVETPAPQPKADVKPVIINGVSKNDIKFAEGDQKFSRVKIADSASACGYGWLNVPKGNVFIQHQDRPQERNVNLGKPGTKLYYQIQGADGKWGDKIKDDGSAFTIEDMRDMWKEQQAAKRASRTAALSDKVEDMTKPVEAPAKTEELDEEAFF